MSESDQQLSAHWQYYADRSREADLGYANAFGQGREELLHETLLFIESGSPFTDNARDKLDRVPRNRAKKHHRLRLYLLDLRKRVSPGYHAGPDDAQGRLLDLVHEAMSPTEWLVECRLAGGDSYAEVAQGLSPDALKMRVSRWRARVREKVAV